MFQAISLLILLLYFFFFLLHFDFYPTIWPDEVLFFSPTESLKNNLTLSTQVLSGLIEGMDRVTLWMPPVYFIYSALFHQIFGDSLFSSRLASIIASLLLYFPLYGIFRALDFKRKNFPLLIILIFTDVLFYKISATARMESLGLFFSLSAIYFLVSNKKPTGYILIGILQGLALVTHPFTIGFIIIELGFYLFYKDFSFIDISAGIIGLSIPLSLWGIYILPNLDIFLLQFGAQLGRKKDLLFSVFTIITKIKIVLSGFKFPYVKGAILIGMIIALFFFKKESIDPPKKKRLQFLYGTLAVLFFLIFLSSESWYVYYLIPFLSFLLIEFYDSKIIYLKLLTAVWILSNLVGIIITTYSLWLPRPVSTIQNNFFDELYKIIEGNQKVFLQSIPDPYFYLKNKNPKLDIKEFIPGELPLPIEFSKTEMEAQDIYIFYNEELVHPTIKNLLTLHSSNYEKFEIKIESPKFFEYKYIAYVYKKKHSPL